MAQNALTASSGLLNSLTSDSVGTTSGMTPGSWAGYGNTASTMGDSGLFGNIGNYMGGAGDFMTGIGGLGQLYLGYQQMQDTKKNNSLYRNIMSEQQDQRSDFLDSTNRAFGGPGKDWNSGQTARY